MANLRKIFQTTKRLTTLSDELPIFSDELQEFGWSVPQSV
jgi:hypothetical protein